MLGKASWPVTVQVLKSGDVATWTCCFPLVVPKAYHVPLTWRAAGSGKSAEMTGTSVLPGEGLAMLLEGEEEGRVTDVVVAVAELYTEEGIKLLPATTCSEA